MTKTDPIAEMLTAIRNGIQSNAETVEIPGSKLKIEVAEILKNEGFIAAYGTSVENGVLKLRIELSRRDSDEPYDFDVARLNRPGRRVELKGPFATKDDVRRVIDREKSLLAPPAFRSKRDLYDTLLETVNRSLGIAG